MPQGNGNGHGPRLATPENTSTTQETGQVVDFREKREQKLEQKRRATERVLFRSLLSVYCVAGNDRLRAIEIVDISEDGLGFQVPFDSKNPWPAQTEDVPLRLYFSQDTFIEIRVKVQNSRPGIDNGARYIRYGCTIDKTLTNYPAYAAFVGFMKAYAEHSRQDQGNVYISYS